MRYQKIHAQIWHDEKFVGLSCDAKLLFLYLLTSPHSNSLGIYVLPLQYAIADIGWNEKRLQKPFRELLGIGFILYDERVKLLCIKNHLKHNSIENENQSKYALKGLTSLPKSALFSHLLELLPKPFHKQLREQLVERYAKPVAVAVTVTDTDKETCSEKEKPKNDTSRCITEDTPVVRESFLRESLKTKTSSAQDFENFYTLYPKKQAKQDAQKAWKTLNPAPILLTQLFLALEKHKTSPDWQKDNGKYIPLPATWLRGRRWEDEVKVDTLGGTADTCAVCRSPKWRTLKSDGGKMVCEKCYGNLDSKTASLNALQT